MTRHLVICVFLTGLAILIQLATAQSTIKITSNAYSGIVVAFHPETPEDEGTELIEKIKELFTNGSTVLFQATKNRAYFDEVTILVPQKWKNGTYDRASSENFLASDVRIDSPNPQYGDGPYTLQTMPCGFPGNYIHLTPNYLKYLKDNSTTTFGDPGKTLVHEWAHLRYGIFDEFGRYKDGQFPMFYYNSLREEVLPNSCSDEKLNGLYLDVTNDGSCNYNGGIPDENCIFQPDLQDNNASTSIASFHFLPNVHFFCENDTHNIRAPNKQNFMCDYKSTWEVIMNHEDFRNNNTSPLEVLPVTKPTFKVVQRMEDTFSVVLDVSGSMDLPTEENSRLKMARDTITSWLKNEVKDGSAVGIVRFSTEVDFKGTMQKVLDDAVRDKLVQDLPSKTIGSTCIGCGLLAGMEQLKKYRNNTGGVIILLTDGEENVQPFIEKVQDRLVDAGIRVNTIAFTTSASAKITKLADVTKGKAYFVNEGDTQALGAAFLDSITYQTADFDLPVKIAEEVFDKNEKNSHGFFSIDQTIGNSTIINFKYSLENDIKNITISSNNFSVSLNDGTKHDNHDKLAKNIQFKFPFLEPGKYDYVVSRNGVDNQKIEVTVMSKANGVSPITTRCWAEEDKNKKRIVIFAEVKQGNNPVINAAVIAKVNRDADKAKQIQLFDGGNEPDVTKHDGIYSGYFKKFTGKGKYSIKAQVAGDGKTSIQEMGFLASQSMPIVNKYMTSITVSTKPTGIFERTATAGIIDIKEDLQEDTTDVTGPGRISNLKAVNTSSVNFTVTLQWTATGGDLDQGNASYYELRYNTNWDELRKFNGTVVDLKDTAPAPSGTDEELTIRIHDAEINKTYFFAIKAYDEANNTSPTSNIAQSTFAPIPTSPPETTSTTNTTSTPTETDDPDSGLSTGVIVGIVIVVILVVVGGGVGVFYYIRKRKTIV